MIFYFSGTGNSRWVAQTLASMINDTTSDISKIEAVSSLANENQIGLVFPIYAWGAPEPVVSFAKKLQQTGAFTFGICTCGADAGTALRKLSKNFHLDSCYSLMMPNNYIIGGTNMDVEKKENCIQKIKSASAALQIITQEITQKKPVYRVEEGAFPRLKSSIANWGFNHFAKTTKPFYATDACTGCGLCEKNCPAHTITLHDKKPVWDKSCFQCLRCIHECPAAAIQYGASTANKGRYTIQKYL